MYIYMHMLTSTRIQACTIHVRLGQPNFIRLGAFDCCAPCSNAAPQFSQEALANARRRLKTRLTDGSSGPRSGMSTGKTGTCGGRYLDSPHTTMGRAACVCTKPYMSLVRNRQRAPTAIMYTLVSWSCWQFGHNGHHDANRYKGFESR